MEQTHVAKIVFDGSHMKGWRAAGVKVEGGVSLRKVTTIGTINLNGASVEGQLTFKETSLIPLKNQALQCQGAFIKGDLFLDKVVSEGIIDLDGSSIGGQLSCEHSHFKVKSGIAFDASNIMVEDGFFWRGFLETKGRCDFTNAHFRTLQDDVACWPDAENLRFGGMTYDRISSESSKDAKERLDWLAKGSVWKGNFSPQPYTHLAKVLREMGHDADARTILLEREKLLKVEERKALRLDSDPRECPVFCV